jgi:hypothetical protein
MFLLDSLMISGIQWALKTVITAAEAEMNDDSALREQLLEAEMRREMGEISDAEFGDLEADLLARIREVKERREGSGALEIGARPLETTADTSFQIEASVSGDFYDPADAPHTSVISTESSSGRNVRVLDMQPGDAAPAPDPGLPLTSERAVVPRKARQTAKPARRRSSRPPRPRPAGRR